MTGYGAKPQPVLRKPNFKRISGDGGEGLGIDRRLMAMGRMAMRTARATRLGAGAQRFVDDGLDRARATAALRAATEAAIELLGVAWKILRTLDGTADVAVAQHVTGTDDH